MKDKQIKQRAKRQLAKIQKVLKKAIEGKDTGILGSELFIDDAAEFIYYYRLVAAGKFKAAAEIQDYDMDTDVRERIDNTIYNFMTKFYDEE